MEASALPASVGVGRSRITLGASLLRIRSDEQLVTIFREGNDNAFSVIHDRYRPRLFAYTRQMLSGTGQDPEDAVQEIFMRAYYGLRANDRQLALRAWLYRIAHNRCVDELRRPHAIAMEMVEALAPNAHDPVAKAEQRDALRRLIADVQRLPDQQRSALLMRELSGMPYIEVSGALGVSVPAVKSLLVRARVSLAQAHEARDTACASIREDLITAHDRGVRTSGLARRHMRDCSDCRQFRAEFRGCSRNLAALAPTLGPLGLLANLLGWGGGAGGGAAGGSGAVAGGGAAAAGGAAGGGAAAAAGLLAGGAAHAVTLLAAAAVVTAGGAVELQRTLATPPSHHVHHHVTVPVRSAPGDIDGGAAITPASAAGTRRSSAKSTGGSSTTGGGQSAQSQQSPTSGPGAVPGTRGGNPSSTRQIPITETLDPDNLLYATNTPTAPTDGTPGATTAAGTPVGTGTGTPTVTGTGTGATTGTGTPASTGTGATTGTGTPTGTATGTPAGTGTGTGATTGTGTPTQTGAGTGAEQGTTTGAATTTTSTGGTDTSGGASIGSDSGTVASTSVGASTTRASRGRRVSFISKRHPRHRIVVGRLLGP